MRACLILEARQIEHVPEAERTWSGRRLESGKELVLYVYNMPLLKTNQGPKRDI